MAIFNTLKNLGVKISLDDFGTGYSSLSHLDNLGVDYLKIDRSFIKDISDNPHRFAICEGLIQISRKLGIKVVAEGIETQEQIELLKNIQCDYGQGYLFCKPLDTKAFLEFAKQFH
jgi:EAL domain-containing protein (putative c-di-GMP-specific phosphodiesterase class I)